jgi:xylulokinase
MAYRLPAAGEPLPSVFDADLLTAVGLRPAQLPDVVATDTSGTVTGAAFVAAGLPPGTPVAIAGHDHAVGAYAAGVREPGQVADSVGTAEAVLSVVGGAPDPVAVGRAGMSAVVTVDARFRALLAGSPGAGAVVQWFLDTEAGGAAADDVFADVLRLACRADDLLVLPYPQGRQTPAPDPAARLQLIGRRPEHTTTQLARAVLEGLCLQARWIFEEQLRLTGAPAGEDAITVLGGPLAANRAWLDLKTLILPRPLRQVTEPEAVAAGAALVGAVRAGLVDPTGIALDQQAVPVPAGPQPDYEPIFGAFVAAATGAPS